MRIAVVLSRFPIVSETFILNQITGLCTMGHRVRIFSRFRPTDLVQHPDIEKYDLLKKTRYFWQIPRSKWKCRVKAGGLILLSFLCRPFQTCRILSYLFIKAKSFTYPFLFTSLQIFLYRPEVIHSHFGNNGNLTVFLKHIDPSVVFLVMFHGHDVRLGQEGGPEYYKDLFATADQILANSENTRMGILAQGADPGKTIIHPEGIELEKFPVKKPVAGNANAVRILTVSRLHPDKGVEYSIRAVGRLLEKKLPVSIEYYIVGDGVLREPLQELVQVLKIASQVHFLGVQDHPGVVDQLQQADIFLLASEHEGLGVVLLEAQASGLPVVATHVDGIPEAVSPGDSAILVPPRDIGAIADALEKLVMNPDRRISMGLAGRKYVEEKYDVDKLNNKLVQYYQGIYPAK